MYDALADELRDGPDRQSVLALPDGSVDRYYHLFDGRRNRLTSRRAFGERLAAGAGDSYRVEHVATTPGGQAVNAAYQAHHLGDDVRLYGHLDHPAFRAVPFDAVSMGNPASVSVYEFDDAALMLSAESDDVREWGVDDLLCVDPDVERHVAAADVVCCANWVSVPGLDGVFEWLADSEGRLVFDPGDLTGSDPAAVASLRDRLRTLAADWRVVVSADRGEQEHLAAALGVDGDDDVTMLCGLRRELGVDAVVLHETPRAVAATPSGSVSVPNLEADRVLRRTGAGDRFDAGLAHGVAAGWRWPRALALGNACASYYVEHGQGGTATTLAAYLDGRETPETGDVTD